MSFTEIRIADLGVIDRAVLELGSGLSVITGETGAGKTMLLTGLGLILGEKADPKEVRTGAERAYVEGRLALEDTLIRNRVQDAGGELDDDELLISRSVVAGGRSRAFLGGRSVPQAVLGEIAQDMVTVHGQSDQIRLRTAARQRTALDDFGGQTLAAALRNYRAAWSEFGAVGTELAELKDQRTQRLTEAQMLRTALAEIAEAEISAGEEETLKQRIERLTHSEDLLHAAQGAHQLLSDTSSGLGSAGIGSSGIDSGIASSGAASPGIALLVEDVRKMLADAAEHDPQLGEYAKRAAEIGYLVADLAADLASYSADIDTDPGELTAAHERLALITGLLRQHAAESSEEVLAWAENAQKRFLELDRDDVRVEELAARLKELDSELEASATELTRLRATAAKELQELVTTELHSLAMPDAQFTVEMTSVERGPHGADEISFLLAAHRGAPLRPLGQGASGGELSRVMLALEVALATRRLHRQHTFVFDEVDAGVGGQAAVEVGRRLAKLARNSQVLVVTHLPQVAAFADHHLVVTKETAAGASTATTVQRVTDEERVTELARMLSGQADSGTARQHAAELLALAAAAD
ncbi:MAG TPA: DNA repair protein RecN [Actinomycetales bacterium]|nr:DNA repair protein RecN [Actinomycetales bacterium]